MVCINLLSRRQFIPVASLIVVTVICWGYLISLANTMNATGSMPDMLLVWTPMNFVLTFIMWWVMMIGMMIPSATPMILLFDKLNKNKHGSKFVSTTVFVAGYLIMWGLFSLLATLAQWGLENASLMVPMAQVKSPAVGGGIFIVVGLYQFTPLKRACLKHCRSPFAFIMNEWQDGKMGAIKMGVSHGAYCLGCCWFLMALLFVGGVMNLIWVAVIAAYVLAEKIVPAGQWVARIGGVFMITFGAYLLN